MQKEIKNKPTVGRIYKHLHTLEHNALENALMFTRTAYKDELSKTKKTIDRAMKPIYGRSIYFPECQTSDMLIRVSAVCEELGLVIDESGFGNATKTVAQTIDNYLGEKVCFFRSKGEGRVPVELERIKDAYLAVLEQKSTDEVKDILYRE